MPSVFLLQFMDWCLSSLRLLRGTGEWDLEESSLDFCGIFLFINYNCPSIFFSANEIYPGLSNTSAPIVVPKTTPTPTVAPSKVAQRTPTPPRFSSIKRFEPVSSYGTSSSIYTSIPTGPLTSTNHTDLTSSYFTRRSFLFFSFFFFSTLFSVLIYWSLFICGVDTN